MIDQIGNRCTGCYACVNICPKQCIRMKDNREGFWFPEIDSDICVKCDQCEQHCPVLTPLPIHKTEKDVKVYALMHKNEEVRKNSSSGGAFSAIADYVLSYRGGWYLALLLMISLMFNIFVLKTQKTYINYAAVNMSRAESEKRIKKRKSF